MYEVSLLAVASAAVAQMVIGFIWYAPQIFGRAWMKLAGITPELAERGRKRMPIFGLIALLMSALLAYVLSHIAVAWGTVDVIAAIDLGFWVWAGFVLPVLIGSVLWEGKPWKLFFINAGYWLVNLIAVTIILFLMS